MQKILIFTDLDGSLLHRDTFKFDPIKDYILSLVNQGIIIIPNSSKTEKEITITVPGGISTTYKTIDIESNNKLHNSIMPAGLQATMSTQELVDLVSYLHSLKEPKN